MLIYLIIILILVTFVLLAVGLLSRLHQVRGRETD